MLFGCYSEGQEEGRVIFKFILKMVIRTLSYDFSNGCLWYFGTEGLIYFAKYCIYLLVGHLESSNFSKQIANRGL
jgi:hypothetical protein